MDAGIGVKPTRGNLIVELFRVNRAMDTAENEVSYFVRVVKIGPPIDHEPDFVVGGIVKLRQLVGFKWPFNGREYLVTNFDNVELLDCEDIYDVTESEDLEAD